MPRAMLVHNRIPNGWRPVAVFLGTANRLDYKVLPGSGREAWAANLAANSIPPLKDWSDERGTWEDWIDWAVDAFTNGHDLFCTSIDPEVTVDATYQKYVLLIDSPTLTPKEFRATDDLPDLGGYKKVKPI